MTTDRLDKLALKIAVALVEDERVQRIIREIALSVLAEYQTAHKMGVVRCFMDNCAARGIWLSLKDGKIMCRNKERFTTELKAVLIAYRREIMEHLELLDAATNGRIPAGVVSHAEPLRDVRPSANGRHETGPSPSNQPRSGRT